MSNNNYYKENNQYTKMLETQDKKMFQKYVDFTVKLSEQNDKILDVGCGTGIFLSMINEQLPKCEINGVDISSTSIKICKEKGLNCQEYDGTILPFNDEIFNIVGSVNVLEHVDNPELFLKEQLRVLQKNGYLIVACPNFLSITNNFHDHTKGLLQKSKNLSSLFKKTILRKHQWEKMKTTDREDFQPDDDACNVTNPIDILKWSRSNNLELITWSSQTIYRKGVLNFLDRFWIIRIIFGSSFMIFKKI